MLQAIRSKATSFVIKILFGLLIVSFGIWGIGDIFRTGSTDTTVAKVGGRSISAEQLNEQVQTQLDRLRGLFGGSIDPEQAKQLGVVDQALQGLIRSNLVELEINRLGLAVGDQAVRDAIIGNPAFHNDVGAFDRNVYNQTLLANHLTDAQFEAIERDELLKAQLASALADGMTPPKILVDALYRARAERRVADLVTLPASAAGAIPPPTEAQIDAFYRAHQDRFQAPERRSFTVAMLRLDDLAATTEVSDAELKDEYAKRQDEFHTPEQRQVEQMLLPDEATAQKAQAQLVSGKDFAAVAKDVAGMSDAGALDLGWVKATDLPPELATPAFAVPQGGTTAPIKSAFGWHILRVTAIKPPEDQALDQVKDKLKAEVARDRAGDRMADVANSMDDALAGGASFADVVKKFALKTVSVADVASDGKDETGKAADLPDAPGAILKTAFATDSGQTSQIAELGDDGYFLLQVDKVVPAAVKPLDAVHDEAARLWQDDARQQALQKAADAIVAEVKAGKSLKDVAAARKLGVTTTPPLPRTGGDTKIAPTLVAKLFDAEVGTAVSDASGDGVAIAQLASIEPANPAADPSAVSALAQQLGGIMQGDIQSEYDQALRRSFPVSIDQANLDRLL